MQKLQIGRATAARRHFHWLAEQPANEHRVNVDAAHVFYDHRGNAITTSPRSDFHQMGNAVSYAIFRVTNAVLQSERSYYLLSNLCDAGCDLLIEVGRVSEPPGDTRVVVVVCFFRNSQHVTFAGDAKTFNRRLNAVNKLFYQDPPVARFIHAGSEVVAQFTLIVNLEYSQRCLRVLRFENEGETPLTRRGHCLFNGRDNGILWHRDGTR